MKIIKKILPTRFMLLAISLLIGLTAKAGDINLRTYAVPSNAGSATFKIPPSSSMGYAEIWFTDFSFYGSHNGCSTIEYRAISNNDAEWHFEGWYTEETGGNGVGSYETLCPGTYSRYARWSRRTPLFEEPKEVRVSIEEKKEDAVVLAARQGQIDLDKEQYSKLFDGDKSTKWCSKTKDGKAYGSDNHPSDIIVWKTDTAIQLSYYVLTTGNDTKENPGRNWKNWRIYGGSFEDDNAAKAAMETSEGWTEIQSVQNDTVLQAENKTDYEFMIQQRPAAYKYYKLIIEDLQDNSCGIQQMAEMTLYSGDYIKVFDYSGAYDGQAHGIKVEKGTAGVTMMYGTEEGIYTLTESPTFTEIGSYTVYYLVMAKGATPTTGMALVQITSGPMATTGLVYTGEAQTLVTLRNTEGLKIKCSLDNSNWSDNLPTAVEAGTYFVYYKLEPNDKHYKDYVPQNNIVEVTIDKAPLTITADNAETIYNGKVPYFGVASIEGFVNEEDESVLQGELNLACDYAKGDNAGEYPINPSGVTADNYDITFVPGTLTVEKLATSIIKAPTAKTELVADGAAQELVTAGEASEGGEMQYKLNYGEWSTAIPEAIEAGPYVVFYKVAGDINHKDEEGSYIILAIEKAAGAYTVTYKGEDGELLATEQVDLHFPEAPVVAEKTFTGWTIETVDESALVLRTVYVFGDPKDVANLPTSQSPAKIIKGQHVFILRGDKTYTLTGQEVR